MKFPPPVLPLQTFRNNGVSLPSALTEVMYHKNHEPTFYIIFIPDFQFFCFCCNNVFKLFFAVGRGVDIFPFCSESWDPHSKQDPLVSKTWGTWCRTSLNLQPIKNKTNVCNIFNILIPLLTSCYFASAQGVKSNKRCDTASKKSKAKWILENAMRILFVEIGFLIPVRLRTFYSSKSKNKP